MTNDELDRIDATETETGDDNTLDVSVTALGDVTVGVEKLGDVVVGVLP
jgi:hypothetical protein